MRFVACKDGKTLGEAKVFPTPTDFSEGVLVFKRIKEEFFDGFQIKGVAGGLPGPFNREKTEIAAAPNLPGWNGKPLKIELEKVLEAPVYLENDAALAALGEATYGAGNGKANVVYYTISTGVGGARVVNGVIDENVSGFEPGSQFVDMKDYKTLEDCISGKAVEAKYGKKPYEITDPAIWDELAKILAYGIHNSIAHWSPDIVVLGGSMMKEVGIPVDKVRLHLGEMPRVFPDLPLIEKSRLGDESGLYGALAYIKKLIPAE